MGQKVYLLGGGRDSEKYMEFGEEIANKSSNKSLFIIEWAKDNDDNRDFLRNYFSKVGYERIVFVTEFDSFEDIEKNMGDSGVLFIAGGVTENLIEKVEREGVGKLIKSFEGIIVGNSAGAYLLSKGYVDKERSKILKDSLGVVNIICKAHYREEFDDYLILLSENEEIYGLGEGSYILFDSGDLSFSGEIYLFKDGERRKVD